MPHTQAGVFVAGMVTMGFVMAGAFFVRFWRQAREGIEATLAQVELLRNQARWQEARAMLKLAQQRLSEDAPAELRYDF